MTLKSVVLPAPFGPISPVIVPCSSARETSSSATIASKLRVTRSTESRAIGAPIISWFELLGAFGRQEDPKRGAAAFVLLDPRAAAVEGGELRHEGQADPCAADALNGRTPMEDLEDRLALLLRYARTAVVD